MIRTIDDFKSDLISLCQKHMVQLEPEVIEETTKSYSLVIRASKSLHGGQYADILLADYREILEYKKGATL